MTIALDRNNVTGAFGNKLVATKIIDADTLVRTHMDLVHKIARNIFFRMSAALPIEDLVQIGTIGLIEAAAVFEMRGVAKFSTYASRRIRGAMIDELRRSATISRQSLRDRRAFAATSAQLAGRLGRRPGDDEMAAALGISLNAYRKAASATRSLRFQSIDSTYSDSSSWFADTTPDAFENLERDQLQSAVSRAIASLPEREAMVLQLFFIEDLGLEEIGSVIGVTGARVCQMKKIALEKVRQQLAGWE